jgi:SH3 domain-containing YSC84-like protein 1
MTSVMLSLTKGGAISMPRNKTVVLSLLTSALLVGSTLPVFGADKTKDEETIRNAATVLQAMVASKDVPHSVLAKADCIIVLPSVKKFAVGIGGTGGRGPMSCRMGDHFSGKWSAPAMMSIGGASAGFQIGGTATDFVLAILAPSAVDKVLNGKTKVGSDVSAAAGPGASAGNAVGGADILTYSRTSGLFAGVSLNGASLSPDPDANQRLYGKPVSASDIVRAGTVTATPAGTSFAALLNRGAPKHEE